MELEKFIPKRSAGSRSPAIHLSRKTGLISINNAAVTVLSLTHGDKIEFLKDKKTGEWYIAKRTGGNLQVRKYNHGVCFVCRDLAETLFSNPLLPLHILASIENRKALSIPIARQSVDGGYFCLLASASH